MTVTDVEIRAAMSDAAIAVVTFKVGELANPQRTAKSGAEDRLSLFLVKREDDGRSRKVSNGH